MWRVLPTPDDIAETDAPSVGGDACALSWLPKAVENPVYGAIDPAMTFVAPIASGIVERRVWMLMHGAIIAWECALPCVTAVQGATSLLKTGGSLGIVTMEGGDG